MPKMKYRYVTMEVRVDYPENERWEDYLPLPGVAKIVKSATVEYDADPRRESVRNMTRAERLAQTGNCPSLYPDECPDVNTCPVHDDGTLFEEFIDLGGEG